MKAGEIARRLGRSKASVMSLIAASTSTLGATQRRRVASALREMGDAFDAPRRTMTEEP